MITLSEKQRRWTKRLGYPLLGLGTFLLAIHYTFPYHRLEDRITAILGESYDVSGLSVRAGLIPGHVVLEGLTLKNRPEREGEKPVEITIDKVDVGIGFLALAMGEIDVDLEVDVGDGTISGKVQQAASSVSVDFETDELPLRALPGIKSAVGGVPLEGGLNARFQIKLPKGKWKEAEGSISISCEDCTIGDGTTKVRPMAPGQTNAFSNEGFTLPKLKLGKIGGKVAITKGVAKFEKFEAMSPDGELYLEGEIRFEDPFGQTQVIAYMRFKSSDELRKREARMADMETMMAGGARRPDGFIGIRIKGPIGQLQYVATKLNPLASGKDKDRVSGKLGGGGLGRPGIPGMPDLGSPPGAPDTAPEPFRPATSHVPPPDVALPASERDVPPPQLLPEDRRPPVATEEIPPAPPPQVHPPSDLPPSVPVPEPPPMPNPSEPPSAPPTE